MLIIVYAPASNDVVIPVTAFSEYDMAKAFLQGVFGRVAFEERTDKKGRKCMTIGNNGRFASHNGKEHFTCDEISKKQAHQLFTGYYGGCGGCYEIVALEIKDGEVPLFDFDLD